MNTIRRSGPANRLLNGMLGVSLIELMISLTLGLIVIAAIGYGYIASRQSFRNQDVLGRMQEDARTAFELMGKDMRMAGFTGCQTSIVLPASNPPSVAPTVNNIINVAAPQWYQYWYPVLLGYENTNETTIAIATPLSYPAAFPADLNGLALAGVAGFVLHGDALTVKYADSSQQNMVAAIAGTKITLNTPAGFQAGQILISVNPNCSAIDIFQAKTAVNGNSFTYDNSAGTASNTLAATGTVPGSTIYPLVAVTYYISMNANGNPSLFRQVLGSGGALTLANNLNNPPDELIEGVQDMQLAYAIDSVNIPANAVNNYVLADDASFKIASDWLKVLGVRVSLLMVSRQSEQGITTKPQQYALDMNNDGNTTDAGETVTPTDLLFRKVFSTTIAIQNRL